MLPVREIALAPEEVREVRWTAPGPASRLWFVAELHVRGPDKAKVVLSRMEWGDRRTRSQVIHGGESVYVTFTNISLERAVFAFSVVLRAIRNPAVAALL